MEVEEAGVDEWGGFRVKCGGTVIGCGCFCGLICNKIT